MRKKKYDTIKGVLIFMVVLGHMLITYDYLPRYQYNPVLGAIYIIHMPLFFIIAGYFSKKSKNLNILKYLTIFLFMNTTFSLYDYLFYGRVEVFTLLYSSWFILILMLYRLLIKNKYISKLLLKKYSLIPVVIVSLLSGFIFKNIQIVRFFSFFYFFALGYKYKFKSKKKYYKHLLVLALVLYIILLIINMPYQFYMMSAYNNNYEIIIRALTYIVDTLLFISIINLIKNKKVPILTKMGQNCIYIYALHRIPVLLITYYLYPVKYYVFIAILISVGLCLLLNRFSKYFDKLFNIKLLLILSILCISLPAVKLFENHELNMDQLQELDDAVTIGYVGDLILLEDQLKFSNNNFEYMFTNMKMEFENTDYVFGVLEGPVDDNNKYSYGNYFDNKELRLNYPTSFLRSIENSGIDFVTISNNHLLDSGLDSYYNTITNLNNSKLDYTGTKNNYKIIEVEGIKIGVLAYTYGMNYPIDNYTEYTNYLVDPYSKEFNKYKKNIHKDFNKLKENDVDMIIVMPHYGTEFNYSIDLYQKKWNDFFISEGADIILGDHSHVIEPIQYKNGSIIISSPGNYINSYIEHDSDISMYVKIYIDKDKKKIITSSVTPIIATIDREGKYYPLLLENTDEKTTKRVLDKFSNVVFKNKVKEIRDTYYYYPNKKYMYDKDNKLELTNEDKSTPLYNKINKSNKICFIGDSITNGFKNGYYPWYIPLMKNFNKEVVNISKEGYTAGDIVYIFSKDIKDSDCDLNIINVGTNDIRYHKTDVNKYIDDIKKIIELTDGEVILLAPWQTTEKDNRIDKNDQEKRKLYEIYNNELKRIEKAYYIDPNPYIKKALKKDGEDTYLLDGVHPNNDEGIKLYSYAVLRGNTK